MDIKRDFYLNKLIRAKGNHMAKVVTGIRRCGKSYLLNKIYRGYLKEQGVPDDHILYYALDGSRNEALRDRASLLAEIDSKIKDDQMYYLILDEIQLVPGFEMLVNGLIMRSNLDVYITGSNSRFLSSDIITEFRGRGWEIRVWPLSFAEYYGAVGGERATAWESYRIYGGLPAAVAIEDASERAEYISSQAQNVYLNDIVNRYGLSNDNVINDLVKVVASNIGSLTNVNKIINTFKSNSIKASSHTIANYLRYLQGAFLIERVERYDIKGRKYIGASSKYYFTDIGIRNSLLGFRQNEVTHAMENIIYNELRRRGYKVSVGNIDKRVTVGGVAERQNLEVDFVADKDGQLYYIQSAYLMPDEAKMQQEKRSLLSIGDQFKKIVITMNNFGVGRSYDDNGIATIGLLDFLMNEDALVY